MPKELIPRKKPEADIALKILGLKANPFHADPDPTEPPRTFADFRETWKILMDKVSTVISRGYNQRLVVFGRYGSGKSHVLRFLNNRIGSNYSRRDDRGIGFYSPIPLSMKFSDLYTSFIRSLSKERLAFLYNLPSEKKLEIPIKNELQNALKYLGKDGPEDEIAWRWICALPTYAEERWKIGVTLKPERKDQLCLTIFVSLLKLLLEKDVKIIFIGIDELEKLRTYTTWERRLTQNLLENFRQLIDSFPERVFFALAATSEWERVFNSYGAFSSRFSSNEKCVLKIFRNKKMAEFKLFIFEYLDLERTEKEMIISLSAKAESGEKVSRLSEDEIKEANVTDDVDLRYLKSWQNESREILLYPFSSEALRQVLEISQGFPRRIIQISNLLIENAIDELTSREQMPDSYLITSKRVNTLAKRIAIKTVEK